MYKGKRILAFVLTVLMLLSLLPAVALAEETAEVSIEGRTNLVTNGGFEFEIWSGSGWSYNSSTYGTKGTLSAEKYRSGAQSVKVGDQIKAGTSAGNKWISYSFDVGEGGLTVGNTYRFIVYAMKGDADSNPKLEARGLNGSKNVGSEVTADGTVTSSTDWVMLSVDLEVPETATKVTVYLRNSIVTDGSYCYFDDFAVYDLSEKLYTVTWKNYDGSVLETDTNVAAGVTPEYNGATPVKASSNGFSYFFSGWSPAVAAVTGDVTYTAQFACMKKIAADDFEGTNSLSWNGFSTKAEYSTEEKQSASQSAKLTKADGTATSKWISYTLSVEDGDLIPGHTYRFVAYSKMGENSNPDMRVTPRYLDATSNTRKNITSIATDCGTSSSTDWVEHVIEYTVPETGAEKECVDLIVYLRNNSATDGSYCYFDDFAVYDLSAEAPAEFAGSNITMGSDLKLNFYFDATKAEETGYAKITREGYEDTIVQLATCGKDASGNYYKIPYAGLNAKEMGDTLSVTVYDAEGTAVSETYTDSIRAYCERNIGKTAAELGIADTKLDAFRTLMVDMLNYGAAAQTKANYKTDALANAGLTEVQKGYGTQANPTYTSERTVTGDTEAYYGTSFNMENEISMNLYVLTSAIEGGKAVVTFKDHYGNDKEQTINAADCTTKGAYTCFTVTAIVAADGRQEITCAFYAADATEPVVTVKDSMESYVGRMVGEYEWLNEVMKFSDAAKAYLH